MATISSSLNILSAMITPAVLILASGSLILTTSQRLSRALERSRKLYSEFEALEIVRPVGQGMDTKYKLLQTQLLFCSRRALYLQRIMVTLFVTLFTFVLTSVSIGVISLTKTSLTWIPASMGLVGIFMLLYATILLVFESGIALRAVREEMAYAVMLSEKIKTGNLTV